VPGQKISVKLDVNNIGPHNGINQIKFSDEVDSNKAIFYASNGTGKSFISRAFRLTSIDKSGSNADDLLTLGQALGTLSLKIASTASPLDEKQLSITIQRSAPTVVQNNSGFIFHVFNSDFVEENIKPRDYTPDGNIEGYILGKVEIDIAEEKRREEKLKGEIRTKDGAIDVIVENAKEELRDKGILPTTNEFSLIEKKRLRQSEVIDDVQSFEDIVRQLELLKQLPERIPDIGNPALSVNTSVFDEISKLLATSYPRSEWDVEFVSYIKKHRSFIENGLEFFSDTQRICPFCKQSVDDLALGIILNYKAFMSDKEAEVLREIESKSAAMNEVIENIKRFGRETETANSEILKLQKYFSSLENTTLAIPNCEDTVFDCYKGLINALRNKSDNIMNTDFSVQELVAECKKHTCNVLQLQRSNSSIINTVNRTKQNTNAERLQLRRNLCKAQYLKVSNALSAHFREIDSLTLELNELQRSIVKKEQQARISKKEKVYETLEYFLNKFFSGKYTIDRETFQIRFLGNNIGQKASSILSDGEKSIVAFCYYLASTHLHLSREDDYNRLFFIIDDPISSMDFHFVYAVAQSLRDIKEWFGINTYDRMWVFTHNLEFFSIVARNHIINRAYVMRPGKIELLRHQLLMPYENHLKDIVDIASGVQQPSHTSANSIRHVLETVCRFEYPEKSLEAYITENETLSNNSCIFSLCQDLSHGNLRNQPPFSTEVIITACKAVVEFMKVKYKGQVDAIQPKVVNGVA